MEAPISTLLQLGWKPFFNKQVSAEEDRTCQPVRVMSVHRGMVTVAGEGTRGLNLVQRASGKGTRRPTYRGRLAAD